MSKYYQCFFLKKEAILCFVNILLIKNRKLLVRFLIYQAPSFDRFYKNIELKFFVVGEI